jgi:RNA polymerase sigma-70 factor (ECF subfamily)
MKRHRYPPQLPAAANGGGEVDAATEGSAPGEVTNALQQLREEGAEAFDRVVVVLYDELRRLAHNRLFGERDGHTLGTTGLVHEAYLRLLKQRLFRPEDREQFLAAASNTMRRVLVDYARARNRDKRGGGAPTIPLDEVEPFLHDSEAIEMLELDLALTRLEELMPRAARVFEMRAFGGLLVSEIAGLLAVSDKTIERDWTAARAWLRKEVRGQVKR